jgi:nucleoside-diphosphate-sugar epimerase
LRLNNTFGPRHQMRHNKYGILNWFLRQAMLGETITIYGEGKQTRDYNYVDDAVDAMVLAAQSSEARDEVFLLGSGKEIPLFEAVNSVVRAAGSGAVTHIPWPKERQEIEVGNFFVSFEKIRKKLGWKPKTGFEDGLRKTVGFYKERKSEYF